MGRGCTKAKGERMARIDGMWHSRLSLQAALSLTSDVAPLRRFGPATTWSLRKCVL